MQMNRAIGLMLLLATTPAWGQPQPSPQDQQPQLRFHPVTRASDPVGIIYAAPVPGGCLLVFGAEVRGTGNNTAQGGVFVPAPAPSGGQAQSVCPRAVR
jgi:hypothetical protein